MEGITPGPWRISTLYYGRDQGNRSIPVTYAVVLGQEVVNRFGAMASRIAKLDDVEADHASDGDILCYKPSPRAMNDAALMAAAPEIYEALGKAWTELFTHGCSPELAEQIKAALDAPGRKLSEYHGRR